MSWSLTFIKRVQCLLCKGKSSVFWAIHKLFIMGKCTTKISSPDLTLVQCVKTCKFLCLCLLSQLLFALSIGDGERDFVGLGYHSLQQHDGPNQQFIQGTWMVHEQFDFSLLDNDIALIHLDTPASLNSDVQAIGIASSEPKTGSKLLVSGWGNLDRKFIFLFIFVPNNSYPAQVFCLRRTFCRHYCSL